MKDGQGRGAYPSRRGIRPCRECRSMRVGCGQAGALATPSCSCSAGTSPNPGGWASDDQPNAPLRCGNAALRDHRQTQFNAARSGEHCYLLTRRKDRRGRTATSQRLSRSVSSRASRSQSAILSSSPRRSPTPTGGLRLARTAGGRSCCPPCTPSAPGAQRRRAARRRDPHRPRHTGPQPHRVRDNPGQRGQVLRARAALGIGVGMGRQLLRGTRQRRTSDRSWKMKAVIMAAPAVDGSTTSVADIDEPQPGPGQVAIYVAYAGVNFIDVMARRGDPGYASAWPYVPGLEIAGTIRSVGSGVHDLHVGERVAAFTPGGGLAEVAVAAADVTVEVPPDVPLATAAAAPLVVSTALLLLTDRARIRPGESVLMHSASGGIGSVVSQVAAALGAGAPDRHGRTARQDRRRAGGRVGRGVRAGGWPCRGCPHGCSRRGGRHPGSGRHGPAGSGPVDLGTRRAGRAVRQRRWRRSATTPAGGPPHRR